ncbi:MAG: ABC transporter permease [Actinobacteria bacterium]|nr:ABC transporter permease [Actinomycetota bacterium]
MTAPNTAALVTAAASPRRRKGQLWGILRNSRDAIIGLIVLGIFIVLAIAGPALVPYGIDDRVGGVYDPPSLAHPLGLDDGGIDMLALLMQGGQNSLLVGFTAAVISMLVGGGIGVAAGYFGGWVDSLLMRITDYFMVVPLLPLAIIVSAVWGAGLVNMVLVIGLLIWTTTARLIRAEVSSVKERAYVQRARSIGASRTRIVFRHIVPQITPLLVANTTLAIASAIFLEAALAFLGLGDPNAITWGKIIELGFVRAAVSAGAWWAILPAGLCIALVVTACSLIGQAVEDALNPRLKVSHLSPRPFQLISIRNQESAMRAEKEAR